jgi:SAM-dependent methyltransferase
MSDGGDLFDEYAAAYEQALANAIAPSGESREYFAKGRVAWLKRCLVELDEPIGTILDFGCGDGATTPLLLRAFGAEFAVGVDVSAKSLEIARKHRDSDRIRYESLEEFRPPGNIDLAYCNGVFHHIEPVRRGEALDLVHRTLRPGGFFSLWENNAWSIATRYVMSRCTFDRDAILLSPPEARASLRRAGFEILRTDFRFVFPRFLRAVRKVEDWVFRIPLGTQYQVLCRKVR